MLTPLREVRAGVLSRPGLVAARLRDELAAAYDGWLQQLFTEREDLALVAVGGLGRREPAPFSDLDLVLLHDGRIDGLTEIAEAIWYPVWDGGIGLDHSVRTPEQAVAVAKDELKALLGLLDIRHIAGDAGLTGRVRGAVLDVWRASAVKRLPELRAASQERWEVAGEGAFLLEPNLKDSRGGLRDGQALRALAMAQLVDFPVWAREAYPGAARRPRRAAPGRRPGRRRAASAGARRGGGRSRRARRRRGRGTRRVAAQGQRGGPRDRARAGRRVAADRVQRQCRPARRGAGCSGRRGRRCNGSGWPATSSRTRARSCSRATPIRGPTPASPCVSPARPPSTTCRWHRSRWTGSGPSPHRFPRRGRESRSMTSSPCSAPGRRRSRCSRRTTRPGCWCR